MINELLALWMNERWKNKDNIFKGASIHIKLRGNSWRGFKPTRILVTVSLDTKVKWLQSKVFLILYDCPNLFSLERIRETAHSTKYVSPSCIMYKRCTVVNSDPKDAMHKRILKHHRICNTSTLPHMHQCIPKQAPTIIENLFGLPI